MGNYLELAVSKYAFSHRAEVTELIDALGIPGLPQSLAIRISVDDFVYVDCTFAATKEQGEVIRRFVLKHAAMEVDA